MMTVLVGGLVAWLAVVVGMWLVDTALVRRHTWVFFWLCQGSAVAMLTYQGCTQ